MPGITKRKDGRYMIRATINGKRITKYEKTLQNAKKTLSALKKKTPEIELNKYLLKDWISKWLEIYKKPFIKEKSFNDIKNSLNIVVNKIGNTALKELTSLKIQTLLNTLPKNRTKERTCLYLNASLQKAVDINLITYNPFNAVVKDKKIKFKHDAFNYEEQKLILQLVKNTNIECAIYIYLLTGCRPAELPGIENIDLQNKYITINGTKNENAKNRDIEISEEFIKYLKNNLTENQTLKYEEVQQTFKNLCVGKIKNALLYRLRHTFASNHFVLGTNPKRVQTWLGHGSIKITLDTYTDIDKSITKDKIKDLYNNYYIEL